MVLRWKRERERERAAEAAAVSRTRIERTVDRDVGGRFAVEAEEGSGGRGRDRQTAYIAVRKEGRGHAMGKDSEYSSICNQKSCLGWRAHEKSNFGDLMIGCRTGN